MRIYTKTGDDGTTGLFGGTRVSKCASRVAAYGEVDELNSFLGWARAARPSPETQEVLRAAQEACFRVGAFLASAPGRDPGVPRVSEEEIAGMERTIDRCEEALEPLKTFVLPGGSEAGARLHVARAVCRRAERSIVALSNDEVIDPMLVKWVNRLSDLLFVLGRYENRGTPEEPWVGRRG
jgi:cob(I)alamin adenosyltransferase